MRWKLLLIVLILSLAACTPAPEPMHLHQIYQRDSIRVGILNGPTSYYVTADGATGYEYELAVALADKLGVKLDLVPSFHLEELLEKLRTGQVDVIASGSTVSESLRQQYRLAPAYQWSDEVLVFRQSDKKPKSLDELAAPVVVLKGSSQAETLLHKQKELPELAIQLNETDDATELLQQVADGKIQYTVADSHLLAINQRFYPNLGTAMVLKSQQPVAWLLAKNNDDSLMSVLVEFFGRSYEGAELLSLEDKYFGHVRRFNYADTLDYIEAIDKTLPRYRALFEQHSGNLDWRLLAAIAYQESRWDPKARSPQGVVGMMMLTVNTANLMKVTSRVDAAQSIRGGSKYLQKLIDRIPERVQMPDRLWFALAGYNIGYNHVESARMLTEKDGADPDKWAEVKQRLSLLRQRKYYSQTRTGYARGDHAVYYVENIRRYFDTLLWVDEKKQAELKVQQQKQKLAEEYSEQLEAAANKPVVKDHKKPAKTGNQTDKSGPGSKN
ncbi:membrane-bound lytic murein transglycosylase MltF [Rheinheimera sp.]|uniref:membrane-bound lytic murein transglycosylase MltF n=1 Tax=Rheinheimera sp. TaxID=1869214 RepID=UPI0027B9EDB6|nr:membrane-bound lytic murein transglycosylase MltF [Rheinheimera sp.]